MFDIKCQPHNFIKHVQFLGLKTIYFKMQICLSSLELVKGDIVNSHPPDGVDIICQLAEGRLR